MLSLHKTVRKYFGEAIVVTQEVEDIISSPIVKESIINNSDCKILLDQRKYLNKFDSIQNLLGLTDKERSDGSTRKFSSRWAARSRRYMPQKFRWKNITCARKGNLTNVALASDWASV